MRLWLLASSSLILATASANAGSGPALLQPSGGTGLWSRGASLMAGREEHTATLLRNGRLLIAGGTDGRGHALASAEVYDAATDRWRPGGSMSTTRLDHTATLLPSGKVLVVGGFKATYPSESLASSELYDPATNSWSSAAPMTTSRTRHTATALPDGRVLVVGGQRFDLHDGGIFPGRPTDAEIYDPIANRWSATGPMGASRLGHTATLLPDGRVFVVGGQDDGLAIFNSTEIYDPANDRWISAAPMAVARTGHLATAMANGDVFVAGGLGEEPNFLTTVLTSAELFDPRTNVWVTIASAVEFHAHGTATLLRNGMVLAVGATDPSRSELYDLGHNRWTRTGPTVARYQHTATRLGDGRVLIVGGYGIESLGSVVIYDPEAVAPAPVRPPDPRVIAALLITASLIAAAMGWSIPAVRQRVRRWRPPRESEEWIT